jgi:hypothetical protein
MGFGGALFALSAVSAVTSISEGYARKAEANFNAAVSESQARMIDVQKEIEYGQYQRQKGKTLAKSMANIAAMGIMPTGSSLAAMLDAQTQIGIDQIIGQVNLEREKNYALSQASSFRRQGKMAVRTGYSNAFASVLQGASSYALYTSGGGKGLDTDSGSKKGGKA